MIKKELYAAPETEVLELRYEGFICLSEGGNNSEELVEEGGTW